jgi:hypothetical protein
MTPQRKKAEELIYSVYDAIDKTHTNSDYYRELFAKMSDEEFMKFCTRRLPFRFHENAFNIEPKMYEIIDGLKIMNVPLMEKVKLPYVFKDPKTGEPVETQEAMVIYVHLKRMKQMLTKKNHTAMNIDERDMKTGSLVGESKGSRETYREFESLALMDLDYTMEEFARPKADAMSAVAQMSNEITTKGSVSQKDLKIPIDDMISRRAVNVYLMGAHIHSNLLDTDYMTPLTAKNKQQRIERI